MSKTSGSGFIEVYLNLLNAAFQLFSVRQASAHAPCWHSSNPLLREEIASSSTALSLSVREN